MVKIYQAVLCFSLKRMKLHILILFFLQLLKIKDNNGPYSTIRKPHIKYLLAVVTITFDRR